MTDGWSRRVDSAEEAFARYTKNDVPIKMTVAGHQAYKSGPTKVVQSGLYGISVFFQNSKNQVIQIVLSSYDLSVEEPVFDQVVSSIKDL